MVALMHIETGQRFGRLTVARLCETRTKKGLLQWLCDCDCGAVVIAQGALLRAGNTKSCGCYRIDHGREHGAEINLKHGEGRNGKESPEYRAWCSMKSRCENPGHRAFPDYGGRGILVCARWLDAFENFLKDMSRRPSSRHSLGRLDNEGHYEPDNCRWATPQEQNQNRRPTRKRSVVTIGDTTKVLADWLAQTGTPRRTFYNRLHAGMSDAEALGLANH
jgi:hypothetical protein